jgi:two-component system, OmpR family, sensor histidine kinase KdpD
MPVHAPRTLHRSSSPSAHAQSSSRAPAGRGTTRWHGYAWSVAAVALTAAFSGIVSSRLELSDLVMLNLLPVIAVSLQFGFGPSLVAAGLSALCFDFFFIPPVFSFAPSDLKSVVTLTVMVIVAVVISGLAERARRQHQAAQTQELRIETERLRNSLLSAVSHDLRTPLATIFGAGTELLEQGADLTPLERGELIQAIVEEAARLDQLVTNLLEVARLEGGPIEIRKRPEPLDEVVEAALSRLRGRLGDRPVRSRVPEEIPMVPIDAVLIQQVLVNLLENALRYTTAGTPLEIEASRATDHVVVEVRDRGPGIEEQEADRLFERFYRGHLQSARDGGVGLGLTICRSIVRAHGGEIALFNRDQGGAIARFTLPLLARTAK